MKKMGLTLFVVGLLASQLASATCAFQDKSPRAQANKAQRLAQQSISSKARAVRNNTIPGTDGAANVRN